MVSNVDFKLLTASVAATALWALLLFAPPCRADMVTFTAEVGDETRAANTEAASYGGIAYVSLSSLARQFRGECVLLQTRAQVDFTGKTAWLQVNGASVNSSQGQFALTHPVLRQNDQALMALADVGPFFDKAFGVAVSHTGLTAAPQLGPRGPLPAPGERDAGPPEPQSGSQPREPSALDVLPDPPPSAPVQMASESAPRPVPQRLVSAPFRRPGIIIIDAGHGGSDEGAVGVSGLTEKALCLELARQLQAALQATGRVQAMLTRPRDVDLGPIDRARLANYHQDEGSGLFISLHTGASFSGAARGFELFCPPTAQHRSTTGVQSLSNAAPYAVHSLRIAESVSRSLLEATGADCRGVRQVRCRVLESLRMPGFMLEVGCLTNPAEETRLQSKEYQAQLVAGLVQGILPFLEAVPPVGDTP